MAESILEKLRAKYPDNTDIHLEPAVDCPWCKGTGESFYFLPCLCVYIPNESADVLQRAVWRVIREMGLRDMSPRDKE